MADYTVSLFYRIVQKMWEKNNNKWRRGGRGRKSYCVHIDGGGDNYKGASLKPPDRILQGLWERLPRPHYRGGEENCRGAKTKNDHFRSNKSFSKLQILDNVTPAGNNQMTGCQRPCKYLEYSFIGEKQQTAFVSDDYVFSLWAVSADTVKTDFPPGRAVIVNNTTRL